MATNIQLPSKENLKETLSIGNFTGNGQTIIPENGNGGLDLRNQNTDNIVLLTNDFLGALGYVFLGLSSTQLGFSAAAGAYFEASANEAFIRAVGLNTYWAVSQANGGLKALSSFGDTFVFVVVENALANRTQETLGPTAVFIHTGKAGEASTILQNVLRSVVISGKGITAKTDDTTYLNQISFQESGSLFDAILRAENITADRFYDLPDESGELALNTWGAPVVSLGSLLVSGATYFINPGAGVYLSFSGNSDDSAFLNVCLSYNGIPYDGSDLQIVLKGRLSSSGSAGDTVGIILEYAINGTGDNTTSSTLVAQQNVDVSSEVQDIQFDITLGVMTGVVGANQLMVTITRRSMGGGGDTYSGNYELTSIMINKA
jgi:hypothetical protein